MKREIEIFLNNQWHNIACFEGSASECHRGYSGGGTLNCHVNYAAEHFGVNDIRSLSCNYSVSFELSKTETWPAFLLEKPLNTFSRKLLELPNLMEERNIDNHLIERFKPKIIKTSKQLCQENS